MVIGIDIDGVILDFERTVNNRAEMYDLFELHKNGVTKEKEFYSINRYDWTKEERDYFIDNYLVPATEEAPLMPGAKEGMDFLHQQGFRLEIITARGTINRNIKKAALDALKKYDIYYDDIHFEVEEKVSLAKELNVQLMLEDNPNTCQKFIDAKIPVIYFRDKNSHKLKESEYLKEVSNWGDICRYILNEKNLSKKM